jgi:hypothetical protein
MEDENLAIGARARTIAFAEEKDELKEDFLITDITEEDEPI